MTWLHRLRDRIAGHPKLALAVVAVTSAIGVYLGTTEVIKIEHSDTFRTTVVKKAGVRCAPDDLEGCRQLACLIASVEHRRPALRCGPTRRRTTRGQVTTGSRGVPVTVTSPAPFPPPAPGIRSIPRTLPASPPSRRPSQGGGGGPGNPGGSPGGPAPGGSGTPSEKPPIDIQTPPSITVPTDPPIQIPVPPVSACIKGIGGLNCPK